MSHMKRLAAPKAAHIKRKKGVFIIKPCPGPHPKHMCVSLGVLLRDILHVCENRREIKKLLHESKVLVDSVIRKDMKFPVGFMDVVAVGNKIYRIIFDKKGRIKPIEIKKKEANLKICMIKRKMAVKGGKIQITLHDGRNILLNKTNAKKFKNGSSVLITLPDQKITGYVPYEKGAEVFIISGRHVGKKAKVVEIRGERAFLKTDKEEFETLSDYAVPISKEVSVDE